ncbi:procathepsin L-like [Oppia nitens]|uniref:procathepsin L-like n=1 Tax=Oppia nitens TaxID=1686743 RepID=UPI0023DBE6A8|nr:procathepsin L-like [Oppia nitens]
MSDMKWPEIQKQKFGFKRPIARNKTKKIKFDKMLKSSNSYDDNNIPLEWDWRKYGIVTPSINQGNCGCCWSFASASVLESHLMKVQIYEGNFDPNNQLYLSQQNLIDCSREYGTEGCDGGSSKDAFEYVQSANQLNTYNAYPYTGIPNNCYFNRGIDVEIREVNRITTGADDELVSAIYKHGPVTVSFDANINFMNYRSGIYEEPLCDPENISHYMVAVGYTPEYFIVKNSWGENWGEGGFIRVSRSKLNNCGISEQDYYPVLTNDVGTDQMRDKLKEIY